jgi:hypothetical protein
VFIPVSGRTQFWGGVILGGGLEHLDWDDFRVFAAVVRAGSFTRAARELELTEPTVSRRIKRLE